MTVPQVCVCSFQPLNEMPEGEPLQRDADPDDGGELNAKSPSVKHVTIRRMSDVTDENAPVTSV